MLTDDTRQSCKASDIDTPPYGPQRGVGGAKKLSSRPHISVKLSLQLLLENW